MTKVECSDTQLIWVEKYTPSGLVPAKFPSLKPCYVFNSPGFNWCCVERCFGHKLDVRAGTSFLFWGWEEAPYSSPGVWWLPSCCNLTPLTFTAGELWVREKTVFIFPGRSNDSPRPARSEKHWEGWVADVRARDRSCMHLKLLCEYMFACAHVFSVRYECNIIFSHSELLFSNTISWTIHFSPVICNDITSYITFLYMCGFISRFFILFCLVNLSWLPKLHNKSISGRVSFFFFPSKSSLLVRLFHKHFYNQILYVSRKRLAGLLTTYWVYKLLLT